MKIRKWRRMKTNCRRGWFRLGFKSSQEDFLRIPLAFRSSFRPGSARFKVKAQRIKKNPVDFGGT